MKLRRCTACGFAKPRTSEFFHRDPKEKFGLRHQCKDCYRVILRMQYRNRKLLQPKGN